MNTIFNPEVNYSVTDSSPVKRILLVIGLICFIIAAIVGAIVSWRIYRLINPYLDRELAGESTISSEWMEITPKEPLRPERYAQEIVLDIEYPIKLDESAPLGDEEPEMGLILPDGSITAPQVQLVDQDGKVYNLNSPSASLSPSSKFWQRSFGRLETLPKDKVYRTVRIRSDKSFRALKIYWRCYNPWDNL